jgi:hypothetical protein
MGLVLYEMIYGVTPWHSQNLVELMQKLDSKVNISLSAISKAINLPCESSHFRCDEIAHPRVPLNNREEEIDLGIVILALRHHLKKLFDESYEFD